VDVRGFLQIRVEFLRQLYETSTFPYVERKRKIECGEAPYVDIHYGDDEAPYLSEWMEADQSVRVLGQMSVSTLAAALQLYLKESHANIKRRFHHSRTAPLASIDTYKSEFNKAGWFGGYRAYFLKELGIDFADSGCDIAILESLVLARNRSQHPESITTLDARHTEHDLKRLPNPFFVDPKELELLSDMQFPSFVLAPVISISPDRMTAAFVQVESFCDWLEESIAKWGTS
jgi:hypothetical protein